MSTGKLNFFKKVQFSRAIRRIVLSHFPLLRSYFLLISGAPSMPALVQLFVQARSLHSFVMAELNSKVVTPRYAWYNESHDYRKLDFHIKRNFMKRIECKYFLMKMAAPLLALTLFLAQGGEAYAAAQIVSDVEARRALPIVSNETEGWPQGPVVSAQSAVVMEASTGAILYEKDAHDQLYPASITKIMTTLVALEHSTMDETVTFSYDSVFSLDTGSSIIGGVNPGDTMSMKDVLYGIMICSGNEAAYAAAEHVGGSIPAFVDMMNARAQEIGCTDTHFENPHGLPNENHVTSAMDMAKITRTALENTAFKTIATTRRYTFPPTSSGEERIRLNHHKMMEGMEYAYDGCLGGKTGYTSAAGSTLVTFAQRDGMMLICVVMNEEAPSQFLDTATLLDYGFANFRKVDMSEYGQGQDSENSSFFLTQAQTQNADTGLSVRQNGTAVLPVNASVDDVKGEAQAGDSDFIIMVSAWEAR